MQGMGPSLKRQRSDDDGMMTEDEMTTGARTPGTGSTFEPATADGTQGDDPSGFSEYEAKRDRELFTLSVGPYAASEYAARELLKTAKVQCRSASSEHYSREPSYSQWSTAVQSARQALHQAKAVLVPGPNLAVDSFITPTFKGIAVDHNDRHPRTRTALLEEWRIVETTCQREESALKEYNESRPKDAGSSTDLVIRSA